VPHSITLYESISQTFFSPAIELSNPNHRTVFAFQGCTIHDLVYSKETQKVVSTSLRSNKWEYMLKWLRGKREKCECIAVLGGGLIVVEGMVLGLKCRDDVK
jgi:hypothetical protein